MAIARDEERGPRLVAAEGMRAARRSWLAAVGCAYNDSGPGKAAYPCRVDAQMLKMTPHRQPAGRQAAPAASPPVKQFKIGPDRGGDLREHRPYFLIPLVAPSGQRPKGVLGPVRRWLDQRVRSEEMALQFVHNRICDWTARYVQQEATVVRPSDLVDPAGLLRRLLAAADGQDPLSRYIGSQLSDQTRQLLAKGRSRQKVVITPLLLAHLAEDLSRIISQPGFYDPQRFAGVDLSRLDENVAAHLGQPRDEAHLRRLNRQLLHAAYPNQIAPARQRITDVYVLSHGWHRNFFSAVAAYDRLISRMLTLLQRKRLQTDPEYLPLFLTIHWHSDPGEDQWEDNRGHREKQSFLENVERVFERPLVIFDRQKPPHERFSNVFEDIFHLFAQMSAPGPQALSDPVLTSLSQQLAVRLRPFRLKDAPDATDAHKVAAAWTCYHEAKASRVLLDQRQKPREYVSVLRAMSNTAKFAMGTAGIFLILALLLPLAFLRAPLTAWLQGVGAILTQTVYTPVLTVLGLAIAALVVLLWNLDTQRHNQRGRRFRVLLVTAAWAYLQLLLLLPLATVLLATYLFGYFCRLPLLFDERIGKRDEPIGPEQTTEQSLRRSRWRYVRYWTAGLARLPLDWLQESLPKDSRLNKLVETLDSFAAFWEMQIRGVETGMQAARFLAGLMQDRRMAGYVDRSRIHLLGHSFGGLVLANTVRHLALDEQIAPQWKQRPIHTLCLVQGALASSWFTGERRLLELIDGSITSIYSNYDSANGFYYPVANRGRYAAGFVGLCAVDSQSRPLRLPLPSWYKLDDQWLQALLQQGLPRSVAVRLAGLRGRRMSDSRELDRQLKQVLTPPEVNRFGEQIKQAAWQRDDALLASLAEPPDLGRLLADRYPAATPPWLLNLDASRLIYEGSVAAGGGHSDIFKDELIYLAWAVTRL